MTHASILPAASTRLLSMPCHQSGKHRRQIFIQPGTYVPYLLLRVLNSFFTTQLLSGIRRVCLQGSKAESRACF